MTLPKAHRAEDVEMIRDGGSFAATFSDISSHRYILFFKIRNTQEGGLYTPKQHLAPFIIDLAPTLRPEGYGELTGPRTPVSWESARKILRDIRADKSDLMASRRSLYYEKWLKEMIDVANRNGAPA